MFIQEYGKRSPKLTRVLITGGMLTGKTTLAAKFTDDPTRVIFVSTDGNALSQGYRGIKFEFPDNAKGMMDKIMEVIDLLKKHEGTFDVIVWDLIEDFDETMQTLLREEFEKVKDKRTVWGKITAVYRDLQTLLRNNFEDKLVILLSRENAVEEKNRFGDVVNTEYFPVLRDPLKNNVLKDVDASIRVFKDKKGNHQVAVSDVRYPEIAAQIKAVINKPLPTFQKEPSFEERLNQVIAGAERKASSITGKEEKIPGDLYEVMYGTKDMNVVNDHIKVWATGRIEMAKAEKEAEGSVE